MTALRPRFDQSTVLQVTAFLMLPFAVVFPLGIAALGATAALFLIALALMGRKPGTIPAKPLVPLLALAVLWAAGSAFWSLEPARSLYLAARLLAIAAGSVLMIGAAAHLAPEGRARVERALIAGGFVALVLFAIEIVANAPADGFSFDPGRWRIALHAPHRTANVLTLIVWPLVLAAWSRRGPIWAGVTFAVAAVMLLLLESSAPILAAAVALAVFVLAWWVPRITALVLAALTIAMLTVTPVMNNVAPALSRFLTETGYVDPPAYHRLIIWSHVADLLIERPVMGWGLDATRFLGDNSAIVAVPSGLAGQTVNADQLPLHPHNAFLQIWLELGLPGALLLTAFVLLGIERSVRLARSREGRAACLAALGAGLVVGQLSFGVWQGWWQVTLWISAVLMIAMCQTGSPRPHLPEPGR
ncbi:MAG: O-antigen ligase family protein [Alphaproteobacteria bacterium]